MTTVKSTISVPVLL